MKQKILIESLSMDLLRTALGFHRGSLKMAERFRQEALETFRILNEEEPESEYLKNLLVKMKVALESKDKDDILMYSTLFQNYALKHFGSR